MMFAAARRAAMRRVPALARQIAAARGGRGAAGPGGGAGGAGWSNLTGALAAGGAVALATAFTLGGAASGIKLAEGDTTNVPSGSNAAAAFVRLNSVKEAVPGPPVDYAAVRAAIEDALDDNDDMGPTLVRLAWHASGTYDKHTHTGGSEGATMRFAPESEHGANAGLHTARDFLKPIKAKFPDISYADLWTLAGVVAIEAMGGPSIPWRPGRRDAASGACCPPEGRLPAADMGSKKDTIKHIRDIFYKMGFKDREIVALSGAHALGRCHTDFSGYSGPWTRAPTTFSNEYYRLLLSENWTKKKWDGPEQYEDSTGELMMLPSDMALVWDPVFRKFVQAYADDYDLFAADFAKAFNKLEELGVDAFHKQSWSEKFFRKSLLW